MASAKFQYKDNAISSPSFGTMLGDWFLGTSNAQNQANTQMLNYQNQFNEYMQDKANAFNSQMFDKANAFNKEMSSTAYQRAMADMNKAGINPLIAFNQGASPASSPSSAQASSATGSSAASSAAGAKFGAGILGKSTAKIIDAGVNRVLRDTIDSDKKFLETAKVAAKFL